MSTANNHTPTDATDDPLMTPADAAGLLGIKPGTIASYASNGTIECEKQGDLVYFRRSVVLAYKTRQAKRTGKLTEAPGAENWCALNGLPPSDAARSETPAIEEAHTALEPFSAPDTALAAPDAEEPTTGALVREEAHTTPTPAQVPALLAEALIGHELLDYLYAQPGVAGVASLVEQPRSWRAGVRLASGAVEDLYVTLERNGEFQREAWGE